MIAALTDRCPEVIELLFAPHEKLRTQDWGSWREDLFDLLD